MRESIIEDTKFDDKYFPTYHMLTKNRPKISRLSIIPLNYHSNYFSILGLKLILELETEIQSQLYQRHHEEFLNNLEAVVLLMAKKLKERTAIMLIT